MPKQSDIIEIKNHLKETVDILKEIKDILKNQENKNNNKLPREI
jgi:hypothetical protein